LGGDRLDDLGWNGTGERLLSKKAAVTAIAQQADLVLHLNSDHCAGVVGVPDAAHERRACTSIGVSSRRREGGQMLHTITGTDLGPGNRSASILTQAGV
jgi:hypothetical protein